MELESYLEHLKDEGGLDSSGQFTHDLARQLSAYDRFNAADPGHGLSRFVQAAVASGARKVFLGFSTYCWAFKFHPPELGTMRNVPLWPAAPTAARLAPQAWHLLQSWLSLASLPAAQASLRCQDSHRLVESRFDRTGQPKTRDVWPILAPARPECSLMVRFQARNLKQALRLWSGPRSYKGALEGLLRRLRHCPIPFFINSRTPRFPANPPGTSCWQLWGGSEPYWLTPQGEVRASTLPEKPGLCPLFLGEWGQVSGCRALVNWSSQRQLEPCTLHLVKDGLLLNPFLLDGTTGGFHFTLCPAECPTDASGLSLVNGARVEWAQELVEDLLGRLHQALEGDVPEDLAPALRAARALDRAT